MGNSLYLWLFLVIVLVVGGSTGSGIFKHEEMPAPAVLDIVASHTPGTQSPRGATAPTGMLSDVRPKEQSPTSSSAVSPMTASSIPVAGVVSAPRTETPTTSSAATLEKNPPTQPASDGTMRP